jgi:hypothetical protein
MGFVRHSQQQLRRRAYDEGWCNRRGMNIKHNAPPQTLARMIPSTGATGRLHRGKKAEKGRHQASLIQRGIPHVYHRARKAIDKHPRVQKQKKVKVFFLRVHVLTLEILRSLELRQRINRLVGWFDPPFEKGGQRRSLFAAGKSIRIRVLCVSR